MQQLTIKMKFKVAHSIFFPKILQRHAHKQAFFSEWEIVKIKTVDTFDSVLPLIHYYKCL